MRYRNKHIYYYFVFITFTIFTGCKKEIPVNTQPENNPLVDSYTSDGITRKRIPHDSFYINRSFYDSIPLKYVWEGQGTTSVDIDGDGNYDVVVKDSVWYYYTDPHKWWRFNLVTIKSLNPKLTISPGKFSGQVYIDLKKDSVVNNSLRWYTKYVCDGWEWSTQQGLQSEYVGLKMVNNSHTYFGWLHQPENMFEFAIDTSNVVGRNVLAGRKKK
jgi:hypothetical protein